MKSNRTKTVSAVAEGKMAYNMPAIEIIISTVDDIITTSGGFPGEDDIILPADNF